MNLTERTGKTRQPQRQGTERPDRHGVTTGELKTVTNMETTLTQETLITSHRDETSTNWTQRELT